MYILVAGNNKEYFENLVTENNLLVNDNGYYYSKSQKQCTTIQVTKIKHITHFYEDGTDITIVDLPLDHKKFRMKKLKPYKLWEVNMFKFGEKFSLYDLSTYEIFGLKFEDNKYIMDHASYDNKIEFLDWFVNSNYPPHYSEKSLNWASECGNINILNWWLKSGLQPKYTSNAIDLASFNCHIDVLDWWLNSGLELKYTKTSMNFVYDNNICYFGTEIQINILNWWLNSNLKLFYDEEAIDMASEEGFIDILNWWLESGLELKYTSDTIDFASNYGKLDVLDWWLKSGLELKYTSDSLDYIFHVNNSFELLNWWINSGLEVKYTDKFITKLIRAGNIEILNLMKNHNLQIKCGENILDEIYYANILDWWIDNNLLISYSEKSMDYADIEMLNWWLESGLPLKYSAFSMDYHYLNYFDDDYINNDNKHIEKLNWWVDSGLPLKYSEIAIDFAFSLNKIVILNWWYNSGLPLKYSKHSIVNTIGKKKKECNIDTINWWREHNLPESYICNIKLDL